MSPNERDTMEADYPSNGNQVRPTGYGANAAPTIVPDLAFRAETDARERLMMAVADHDHRDLHYTRALGYWGSVHVKGPTDVMVIGPIGSRSDVVLFWRSGRRVQTGCFEGTLDTFAAKVEEDYGRRLDEPHLADQRDQNMRHRADYRALVQLLRGLS